MSDLRNYIIQYFLDQLDSWDLFIPYESGQLHARVQGQCNVIKEIPHEKGIYYRIKVPDFIFKTLQLAPYLLSCPLEEVDFNQKNHF